MAEDPELLWCFLLERGHHEFSDDDRAQVALWVAGRFATSRPPDFMIETEKESDQVAAFARYWIECGKPQIAAPLARLSLEARERLCGPNAEPTIESVGTLANALAVIDAKESVPLLRQEAVNLIDRYLRVGSELWGAFDFRLGDGAMLGAQLAKSDGRSDDEEALLRRAIDIFKKISFQH